jgi:V8-like Glu-specific endopeptidase
MEVNQYGLTSEGRVVDLNIPKGMISYFINTFSGQSGSPIIKNNRIIGIHILTGRNHEQFNIGRLMPTQTIEIM